MEKIFKGDFIEIEFTGYYNGKVFDSNIAEDLKQLSKEAKPEETIIIIGEKMVVNGLDKELEGKEIGKEYKTHIPYREGFGERKRELVKTIPLKVFTKQKINPQPGSTLFLDNMIARIITVSGARVVTDFNNPLAGKDLDYKFKIIRKVTDEKEKMNSFFKFYFKSIPNFAIQENRITISGEKPIEYVIERYKEKFKELFKKDLEFNLNEKKQESPTNKANPQTPQ